MATVRELITKWGFEVDDSALKSMEQQQKKLQGNFIKLGAVATAALAAVVLPAAALQAAIKDTLTLSEETGVAFQKLEQGMTNRALNLSEKLGFAAKEVAVGFYQVLSTGAKALSPQFDSLSEIALKMAKTVGLEPAEAIEKLADTIKTFGLEGTKAGHVANVLFTASKLAATTVPQLTDAMSIAAPAAVAFNVSIETTTAALALLAEGGIKSQRAGTGLQAILLRLANISGPAGKALKGMGLSAFDSAGKAKPFSEILSEIRVKLSKQTDAQRLANLTAIAGAEHFKTLGTLLKDGEGKLEGWTGKLKESEGALDRAFKIKMSSAAEQSNLLWIRVKNLAAVLGGPLLESLTTVVTGLSDIIGGIRELLSADPELTRFIATWGGFALAVMFLASGMGIVITSIKLFKVHMMSTGLVTAGAMFWMVALAAVLVLLAVVINDNKEELKEFWEINRNAPWEQIRKEFRGWINQIDDAEDSLGILINSLKFLFRLLLDPKATIFKTLGKLRTAAVEVNIGGTLAELEKLKALAFVSGAPSIKMLEAQVPLAQGQAGVGNTFGDINITIEPTEGAAPEEIAMAVGEKFEEITRSTATDLGQ